MIRYWNKSAGKLVVKRRKPGSRPRGQYLPVYTRKGLEDLQDTMIDGMNHYKWLAAYGIVCRLLGRKEG